MPDPWLVLDSVEDVIDGYSERDEVDLRLISPSGFSSAPGCLVNSGGVVAQILPRGGLWFQLLNLRPLSWGRLDVAQVVSSIWMNFCIQTSISLILVTSFFTKCL